MRQLLSIYDIDVARAYISKGFAPIVTGNDGQSDLSRFAILRVSLNLQCQEQFRKKKNRGDTERPVYGLLQLFKQDELVTWINNT